jgi:PAS domain S-box-containing protein
MSSPSQETKKMTPSSNLSIERAEEALKKSEDRFRRIFDHSNDAVLIIDPSQDKILDANPTACKMLGFSRDELMLTPLSAIHPKEMPKFMAFAQSVLKNEKGWTDELSCLTKAGDCLPVEISASIIELDGKICMIAMVRDITERKKAQRALQEANEMLEKRVAERTAELSKTNVSLQEALSEVERLKNRFHAENIYLQEEIKVEHNFEDIISRSHGIKNVLRKVEQVASTDATVLILGETGTGKELLARAVHSISGRRDRPLVKVNCAAIPATLIESELLGHEKGAFTGALSRKLGRFELADGGTVFLDEIGDLPLELQSKLLRVLQEGEFERLGNPRTTKVDARVIAATNRDLGKEVASGNLREDLYYRLNVFPITSPPLRERKDDIPLLVKHFLNKFCAKTGMCVDNVPQSVIESLLAYNWPGNVRELENVIERAVIVSRGNRLELGDWLPKAAAPGGSSRIATLEENERQHIISVLESTGWRVSGEKGAAKILGMKPTTLESKMKKLRIKRN